MSNFSAKILQNIFRLMKRLPVLKNSFIQIPAGPNKGLKFLVNSDSFYASGQYETKSIEKILNDLNDQSIVYDVGANFGYYSLAFSKVVKKVYSFEPLPKNHGITKKHLEVNNIKNVELFPYAISDISQVLRFTNSLAHSSNTYKTESSNFNNSESVIEVQGHSLDALIFEHNFPKPDFLKVDVEGAELDFLKGAEKTLREIKPKFVLATHDKLIPGIKDKCLQFLESVNYNYEETFEIKDHEGLNDFYVSPK